VVVVGDAETFVACPKKKNSPQVTASRDLASRDLKSWLASLTLGSNARSGALRIICLFIKHSRCWDGVSSVLAWLTMTLVPFCYEVSVHIEEFMEQ
jgi:hypothetical protein